jgi:hypothetical protein
MSDFGNVDWWDSARRSRVTLACVVCVALAFLFIVFSPSGWVGLVFGLFIGTVNVYFSLSPGGKIYPGFLTGRPSGPGQDFNMLWRMMFFAAGSFVIWDAVRQFLHHRG